MINEYELEGFRRDRYFARSWALLTRDKGWIKPILVMTVAALVPVVGWLGVTGYALEWARLTAWGVNSAPKQKGVKLGACISTGWRAFVVALVWTICSGLVGTALELVPLLGGLLGFAWSVFGIFVNLMIMVAVLRSAIYQKIPAGLRVPAVWEMSRHDPSGLLRILGMLVLGGAIIGVVTTVVCLTAFVGVLPELIRMVDYIYEFQGIISDAMLADLVISLVMSVLAQLGPAIVVCLVVANFLGSVVTLLSYTALGLWMRQFDVPAWGRDEDPLPPFLSDPRDVPPAGWQAQAAAPGSPVAPAGAAAASGAASPVEPDYAPVAAEEPAPADPEPAAQEPEYSVPEPVAAEEPAGPEPELDPFEGMDVEITPIAFAPEDEDPDQEA